LASHSQPGAVSQWQLCRYSSFSMENSYFGTSRWLCHHLSQVLPFSNWREWFGLQVSPIEYGHVLLVPRVLNCTPQRIDPDTFLLALHMAAEADNPYFRLGYNSLGAFATINHLHFQVQKHWWFSNEVFVGLSLLSTIGGVMRYVLLGVHLGTPED
jgi:hypothetical protein